MIKISIGIPTYNQEKYIEKTLQSLLAQNYPNFEIVVSNNYSTDKTLEILDRYKSSIRIISPEKHLPMGRHAYFTTSQLSGDWLILMSSDDIAKPTMLSDLAKEVENYPDAILVRGAFETIDANGNITDINHILSAKKIIRPPKTIEEQMYGSIGSLNASMFKRTAWKLIENKFPTPNLAYDWAIFIMLSPLGDFIYTDKIVGQYRANYRPLVSKSRVFEELEDDILVYHDLFPLITQNRFDVNLKKLRKAIDKRMNMRIAHTLKNIETEHEFQRLLNILKSASDRLPLKTQIACVTQKKPIRNNFLEDLYTRVTRSKIIRKIYMGLMHRG